MAVYLNDTWSMYFHDPYNEDWRNESYIKISDISSSSDYWTITNGLGMNIAKGMFFLMREHIFPCWDDPSNIDGGCLSMKVLKSEMEEFWIDITSKILCEKILKDDYTNMSQYINGISTSPKKHFCIVKIWIAKEELCDERIYNILPKYHGDIIFKTNKINISHDNMRLKGQIDVGARHNLQVPREATA